VACDVTRGCVICVNMCDMCDISMHVCVAGVTCGTTYIDVLRVTQAQAEGVEGVASAENFSCVRVLPLRVLQARVVTCSGGCIMLHSVVVACGCCGM